MFFDIHVNGNCMTVFSCVYRLVLYMRTVSCLVGDQVRGVVIYVRHIIVLSSAFEFNLKNGPEPFISSFDLPVAVGIVPSSHVACRKK